MSHANIHELSLFSIKPHLFMDEHIIEVTNGWFIGEIAGYIYEVDRDEAIQELAQFARGFVIGEDEHGKYLLVTSKKEYFRPLWERFQKKMESTISLEKYMAYDGDDEETGNYIYYDCELVPMSRFIRNLCLEGVRYYLGGIVGYHN